jgi:hypothetical protein
MAVLIDTSNLVVSNIVMLWKNRKDTEYLAMLRDTYTRDELKKGGRIIEDTLRSMLVSSFGKYVKKFAKGHGRIYVCMDDRKKNYWRKIPSMGGFIEYKGKPKPKPGDDPVPFDKLMPLAYKILDELMEVLPYTFVLVDKCEGDDVIGVLCKHFNSIGEEVIIVSEDKDMVQFQVMNGVKQYLPIKDKMHNFSVDEARAQIIELVITGDKNDGIPNIRSKVNIFVDLDENGKQKSRSPAISAKLKKYAIDNRSPETAINELINEDEREFCLERLKQNRKWILLDGTTPAELTSEILSYIPVKAIGKNVLITPYFGKFKQCEKHARASENFMVEENVNPFANRKASAAATMPDNANDLDEFFMDL